MNTKKIRAQWKPLELHQDTTLDYAISEIYTLCTEVENLQAEIKEWYEALQSLCDAQNGAPLISKEKFWQAAMDEADRLLEKYQKKQALPKGDEE